MIADCLKHLTERFHMREDDHAAACQKQRQITLLFNGCFIVGLLLLQCCLLTAFPGALRMRRITVLPLSGLLGPAPLET